MFPPRVRAGHTLLQAAAAPAVAGGAAAGVGGAAEQSIQQHGMVIYMLVRSRHTAPPPPATRADSGADSRRRRLLSRDAPLPAQLRSLNASVPSWVLDDPVFKSAMEGAKVLQVCTVAHLWRLCKHVGGTAGGGAGGGGGGGGGGGRAGGHPRTPCMYTSHVAAARVAPDRRPRAAPPPRRRLQAGDGHSTHSAEDADDDSWIAGVAELDEFVAGAPLPAPGSQDDVLPAGAPQGAPEGWTGTTGGAPEPAEGPTPDYSAAQGEGGLPGGAALALLGSRVTLAGVARLA